MTWLYRIVFFIGFPFVRLYNRIGVSGRKNIPKKCGVILASNHSSYYDPMVLGTSLWRSLHYLAKAELFRTRFTRFFFTSVGQIKVERGKGDEEALVNAIAALKENKTVVFFPEGTTFHGESLGKGHSGVARVAVKAEVPVVPVALFNTWKIFPRGKKFPRPYKARAEFGKPLYFKEHYGKGDDREITRKITDDIMKEIAKLLGKKYDH